MMHFVRVYSDFGALHSWGPWEFPPLPPLTGPSSEIHLYKILVASRCLLQNAYLLSHSCQKTLWIKETSHPEECGAACKDP